MRGIDSSCPPPVYSAFTSGGRIRYIVARKLRVIAISIIMLAIGLIAVPKALAHVWHGVYIYKCADWSCQADPVNVFFWWNATLSNTLTHFSHHMGWNNTSGTTTYFYDHGAFTTHDAQRADGTADFYWQTRKHARFEEGDWDTYSGTYTDGAAHRDLWVSCDLGGGNYVWYHVSDQYNETRNNIYSNFSAGGHEVGWENYYNTTPYVQCPGWAPASDGWAAKVKI